MVVASTGLCVGWVRAAQEPQLLHRQARTPFLLPTRATASHNQPTFLSPPMPLPL